MDEQKPHGSPIQHDEPAQASDEEERASFPMFGLPRGGKSRRLCSKASRSYLESERAADMENLTGFNSALKPAGSDPGRRQQTCGEGKDFLSESALCGE